MVRTIHFTAKYQEEMLEDEALFSFWVSALKICTIGKSSETVPKGKKIRNHNFS